MFKSLQAKIVAVVTLMLLVSIILSGGMVKQALDDRSGAVTYDLKNRLRAI